MPYTVGIAKNENDLFNRLTEFLSGYTRIGKLRAEAVLDSSSVGALASFRVDPTCYFNKYKLTFTAVDTYELREKVFGSVTWDLIGTFKTMEPAFSSDFRVSLLYEPAHTLVGSSYSVEHSIGDELVIDIMDFTPVGGSNPDCVPSLFFWPAKSPTVGQQDNAAFDDIAYTDGNTFRDKLVLVCTAAGPSAEFSFGVAGHTSDVFLGAPGIRATQGVAYDGLGIANIPGSNEGVCGIREMFIAEALDVASSYQYVVDDKITIFFDADIGNSTSFKRWEVERQGRVDVISENPTPIPMRLYTNLRIAADEPWSQRVPDGSVEVGVAGMRAGDPKMFIVRGERVLGGVGSVRWAIERRIIDAAPQDEYIWVLHGMKEFYGFSDPLTNDELLPISSTINQDARYFEAAPGRNLSDWDVALNPGNPAFDGYYSPCLHVKGQAIRYWIAQNHDGTVTITLRCAGKHVSAYGGMYFPDGPQTAPLFIGGSGSSYAPQIDQDSEYHSNFYDPASDEDGDPAGTCASPGVDTGWQKRSAAMAWFWDSGFKRFVNRFKRGKGYDLPKHNGVKGESSYRCAYDVIASLTTAGMDQSVGYTCQNNIYPWFNGGTVFLKPYNASICLLRARVGAMLGELDGVFAFSASGVAGEISTLLQAGDLAILPQMEFPTGVGEERAIVHRRCALFPNHDYGENPGQWAAMEFTRTLYKIPPV
jgi:hypothetical protein